MKKAIASISTESGPMTIYYNGAGQEITAEHGDLIEEAGHVADNLKDARKAARIMWSMDIWKFKPIQ